MIETDMQAKGGVPDCQSIKTEKLSRRRHHDRVRRQNETDKETSKVIMVLQNENG